MEKVSKQKLK